MSHLYGCILQVAASQDAGQAVTRAVEQACRNDAKHTPQQDDTASIDETGTPVEAKSIKKVKRSAEQKEAKRQMRAAERRQTQNQLVTTGTLPHDGTLAVMFDHTMSQSRHQARGCL